MRSVFFHCLVLLLPIEITTAIIYDGTLMPNNPRIAVATDTNLTCYLHNTTKYNASDIYFGSTAPQFNETIPQSLVTVINQSSAVLRLYSISMAFKGSYYCYVNHISLGSPKYISSQCLITGCRPRLTSNLSCVNLNTQALICRWTVSDCCDRSQNPTCGHCAETKSELTWTRISPRWFQCPKLPAAKVTGPGRLEYSCSWKETSVVADRIYKEDKIYMRIGARNEHFGNLSTFELVNPLAFVKPNPLKDAICLENRSHQLSVQLIIADKLEKIEKFQFAIEYDSVKADTTSMFHYGKNGSIVTLSDVSPGSKYGLRIKYKPDGNGFWSNGTVHSCRTRDAAPSMSPPVCPGCYVDVNGQTSLRDMCKQSVCERWNNCREIVIQWQEIPESSRNGFIELYTMRVTRASRASGEIVVCSSDRLVKAGRFFFFRAKTDVDYKVNITASTRFGTAFKESLNSSVIHVPSKENRPPSLKDVVVEYLAQSESVVVTWSPSKSAGIQGYTVYMCRGRGAKLQESFCQADLTWYYTHNTSYSLGGIDWYNYQYRFYVSVEALSSYGLVSSGMTQSPCVWTSANEMTCPPSSPRRNTLSNGELAAIVTGLVLFAVLLVVLVMTLRWLIRKYFKNNSLFDVNLIDDIFKKKQELSEVCRNARTPSSRRNSEETGGLTSSRRNSEETAGLTSSRRNSEETAGLTGPAVYEGEVASNTDSGVLMDDVRLSSGDFSVESGTRTDSVEQTKLPVDKYDDNPEVFDEQKESKIKESQYAKEKYKPASLSYDDADYSRVMGNHATGSGPQDLHSYHISEEECRNSDRTETTSDCRASVCFRTFLPHDNRDASTVCTNSTPFENNQRVADELSSKNLVKIHRRPSKSSDVVSACKEHAGLAASVSSRPSSDYMRVGKDGYVESFL